MITQNTSRHAKAYVREVFFIYLLASVTALASQ